MGAGRMARPHRVVLLLLVNSHRITAPWKPVAARERPKTDPKTNAVSAPGKEQSPNSRLAGRRASPALGRPDPDEPGAQRSGVRSAGGVPSLRAGSQRNQRTGSDSQQAQRQRARSGSEQDGRRTTVGRPNIGSTVARGRGSALARLSMSGCPGPCGDGRRLACRTARMSTAGPSRTGTGLAAPWHHHLDDSEMPGAQFRVHVVGGTSSDFRCLCITADGFLRRRAHSR